jgi:hypothetical protein
MFRCSLTASLRVCPAQPLLPSAMAAPADNFPPPIITALRAHFHRPEWTVIDGSALTKDGYGRALKALKRGTLLVILRTPANEALWAIVRLALLTGGPGTFGLIDSARMVVFERDNMWATRIAPEKRIMESLERWCNKDHDSPEECIVCMEELTEENRGTLCCTCDKRDICLKCQTGVAVQSPDGKYYCPHCRAYSSPMPEETKDKVKNELRELLLELEPR